MPVYSLHHLAQTQRTTPNNNHGRGGAVVVVVEEEGEAGEEGRVGWMWIDWLNVVEIDNPMSLNLC